MARLRSPNCPEKTLDLFLQALGLLCEFAGRVENQFSGISHFYRLAFVLRRFGDDRESRHALTTGIMPSLDRSSSFVLDAQFR